VGDGATFAPHQRDPGRLGDTFSSYICKNFPFPGIEMCNKRQIDNMTPANPLTLKCPHCKGEKQVLQLASGNTFGGCQWSDMKTDFPMLPEVSMVQKCPHCGKYYFTALAEKYTAEDGFCHEKGELNLSEAIEAYRQFRSEGLEAFHGRYLNMACMTLIWAANDCTARDKETRELSSSEQEVLEECLRILIEAKDADPLATAEFCRELGDFDRCIELIDGAYGSLEEGHRGIADMIKEHARSGDRKVFIIWKD